VEQSGKAKSTISVHLDDLEKQNLIREKSSPEDKRKKYFFSIRSALPVQKYP